MSKNLYISVVHAHSTCSNVPTSVTMDISTICTLGCPECLQRNLTEEDKKKDSYGYLKFEDFKNFVDNNDIKELLIVSSGEIFTNPYFDKIIEYAHSKNINMIAGGGAHLNDLTEETSENMVKCKLKSLIVSIDGATPETYSIYRIGGDFNKVISNIKMINKYKEKYKSQFPILVYKFIVFGHNEHEIEQAKELAKKLNMEILFRLITIRNTLQSEMQKKSKKKQALLQIILNQIIWLLKTDFPVSIVLTYGNTL